VLEVVPEAADHRYNGDDVVPRPTHAIQCSAAVRRHNRDGCIAGGPEWKVYRAQKAADEGARQSKNTASERAVRENKRVDLLVAESELAAADGELGQLTFKSLRALIFSRTGRTHKAKNNRDDALHFEARAALETCRTMLLPPTTPRALALDDENGMRWCARGAAIDWMSERKRQESNQLRLGITESDSEPQAAQPPVDAAGRQAERLSRHAVRVPVTASDSVSQCGVPGPGHQIHHAQSRSARAQVTLRVNLDPLCE
jgi:hypothetical protein